MLHVPQILRLHDAANAHGHDPAVLAPVPATDLEALILDQHQANFDLWHCEDQARDPGASDASIVATKRAIDCHNQRRNDLIEQLDATLLAAAPHSPDAPLHSETPGLILDRLSILSLKIFHTNQHAHDATSTPEHRTVAQQRLTLLQQQREDLAACLTDLWSQTLAGTRRFQLYKQLKMYNDAAWNPVLRRHIDQ